MSAVTDDALLQQAVAVAKQAGGIIIKYYGASDNLAVQWIAADSVFHSSEKTREFLQKNGITQVVKFGSAVKFGKLAEDVVDLYPRFEGSKEWDIAAGHCILREAGCNIIDWVTKREPVYNKPFMENNFFVAARNDILNFLLKKSDFPDELRG